MDYQLMSITYTQGHETTALSAFVTDGLDTWLETQRYQGYSLKECRELYRAYMKENGLKLA